MAEDRKDYWAAFAIGAILGVGATLLLMPRQEDTPQRILRRIEPALKRARKGTRRRLHRARKTLRNRF